MRSCEVLCDALGEPDRQAPELAAGRLVGELVDQMLAPDPKARFSSIAGMLRRIERIYLDELMATADAVEGITAFLDKRAPSWRHA